MRFCTEMTAFEIRRRLAGLLQYPVSTTTPTAAQTILDPRVYVAWIGEELKRLCNGVDDSPQACEFDVEFAVDKFYTARVYRGALRPYRVGFYSARISSLLEVSV